MPDPIERSPFDGSSTLLMGVPGSGKTYSLITLVEAGLKLAVIFTEPRGPESLMQALQDKGLPIDNVHWTYVPPAAPSWEDMIKSAETINRMTFEGLSQIKSGINTGNYGQFITLLEAHANFKCDNCGEEFGSVDKLDASWAVVDDSLSGINIMAKDLMVGSKPTAAKGEWGVAMDNLERFLLKLASDLHCFYVLTAHLERQIDELEGGVHKVPSALGNKLSPKVPRFFSDAVHCYREKDKFYWSTESDDVDTKFRNLSISDKLEPSFVPLYEAWKKKRDIAASQKETKAMPSSKTANPTKETN